MHEGYVEKYNSVTHKLQSQGILPPPQTSQDIKPAITTGKQHSETKTQHGIPAPQESQERSAIAADDKNSDQIQQVTAAPPFHGKEGAEK